jgi:hypothetical protein
VSLSERISELRGLRAVVRVPRLPDVAKIERSYEEVCRRYEQVSQIDKVDYAALIAKLQSVAKSRDISSLSLREMRLSASCLFDGEQRLADDARFLDVYLGALRSIRSRVAIKRLIHTYCTHFDEKHAGIRQIGTFLREAITNVPSNRQWLWPKRHQRYGLFNPMQAPSRLCEAALATATPRQELESAGLGGSLLSSGLSSTVFLNALLLVERRLSGTGREDVDRVIAWAKSEEGGIHYSAHRGAIANTLLSPWANGDPEPTVRGVIQRFLLECLGDPRIDRGAWLGARQTAREVIIRWLAQATLEQFLKVVDHVAERHQWDYRRAFWSAYIEKGFVSNAWVAFGSSGAQVARKIAETTADPLMKRFAALGGSGPDQAVLLLSIGDLIVADWSHNGRLRIWRKGNREAPEFSAPAYSAIELRKDSDFDTVHIPADGWQSKAENYIRRYTGIKIAEHEYLPRRGKR